MRPKGYRVRGQIQALEIGAQCTVKLEQRRGASARDGRHDFGFLPVLASIETDVERRAAHRSANDAERDGLLS